MDEDKLKARDFIEKRNSEREKLFLTSQPIYANFFTDKRNIFGTLATVSATIGAFSFLLFSSAVLKSRTLLITGDLLLLATILLSLYFLIFLIKDDLSSYHKTYYDAFERLGNDIDQGYKVLLGELTGTEFKDWAGKELKNYVYKRPPLPTFKWHWIAYILFFSALFLIALSFLDFSYASDSLKQITLNNPT